MLNDSITVFLQDTLDFWPHLNTTERNNIITHTSIAHFTKGETLRRGDQNCMGLIMIRSGQLRVYMLSEEGKDITLFRLAPGELCLLSASCILSQITFDVHIDVEEPCELVSVSSHALSEIMTHNIYVENFIYKRLVDRFSDVMWAMEQILFMSFDKRLAIFLVDEMSKTHSTTLRLTHEQIAKYIGSAREVVSRMLKYFSNEGIVELSRGGITIINPVKLKSLI